MHRVHHTIAQAVLPLTSSFRNEKKEASTQLASFNQTQSLSRSSVTDISVPFERFCL
jgi:hypothetical protein